MKPSHIMAPRQLADCSFTPSADPIERPAPRHMHAAEAVMLIIFAPLVVIGIAALFAGWIQ